MIIYFFTSYFIILHYLTTFPPIITSTFWI